MSKTKHAVTVKTATTKGHTSGHGVVFTLTCCGKHHATHHIQNAGLYAPEELLRLRNDLMAAHAKKHHAELRALETLATRADDSIEVEL